MLCYLSIQYVLNVLNNKYAFIFTLPLVFDYEIRYATEDRDR